MARSQRYRLYDAEDELIGPVAWYASKEAMQFEVDRFIARVWWKRRCPVEKVDIEYPVRGSGAIRISEKHWKIGLSGAAACNLNLGHEMTHVFMNVTDGEAPEDHEQDHSAHFAGAELEIVKRFIGPTVARRLKAEFEAQDVSVIPYRDPIPEEEQSHEELA
jgi:hypothetical protein